MNYSVDWDGPGERDHEMRETGDPKLDLMDLIARLEKATRPDRQLDRMIEETLPGVRQHYDKRMVADGYVLEGIQAYLPAHYTASIDAALPGEDIVGTSEQHQLDGQPVYWIAIHRMPKGRMTIAGRGRTEALARRIAALKARASLPAASSEIETRCSAPRS